MKKVIFSISFFLLMVHSIFSQSPEKVNYQTVIKDTNGDVVSNQDIAIQININQSTINGTTVYSETHEVTTSDSGLISLQIGDGTTTNNFSTISWGSNTYFLNIAVDLNNGTNFTDIGTQQLVSVPYALHANTSDSISLLKNNNTTVRANSVNVEIDFNIPGGFTFSDDKMVLNASNPSFGSTLQLEFKDGTNINSINNVFPNDNALSSEENDAYQLNLIVRGNETLSARGDGSVRINNEYTLPKIDGTAEQVLVTDGSGTIDWGMIAKLADADGNTQIQVEEIADENIIRFDVEGTEHFTMKKGRIETLNNGLSVFIGENAGLNDDFTDNRNVAIGYKALEANVDKSDNTAIGAFSLSTNRVGTANTVVGIGALQSLWNGNDNVAIGAGALSTAEGNIFTSWTRNVAVGFEAGLNNEGRFNVFLGYQADVSGIVSRRLAIANSNTTTPLIYGEFDTNLVRVNGDFNTTGNATTDGTTTTTGQTTTPSLKVGPGTTLSGIYRITINRNVGNINGNTSRVEQFPVTGARRGDVVYVSPNEELNSRIVIAQCWVSTDNIINVRFRNTDGGSSRDPDGTDGASYSFSIIR